MKRIMIIGQPGSGKSTLARELGRRTGLPVYHMDQIHWMAGWQERAKPEKIALATDIEDGDEWIFEGGLRATMNHRLGRCDTLINLDLALGLRAWRVAKRTVLHFGRTRPDLPDGCPEHFSAEFWAWIWRTRTKNRVLNLELMAQAGPLVTQYLLQSPRDVSAFLEAFPQNADIADPSRPCR